MLTFSELAGRFAVCRLEPQEEVPGWASAGEFLSVTRTGDELSIVCPESQVPRQCQAEHNWRCLKVDGPLPLDAVGILSSISTLLAAERLSIFVVSTYDTDYILVRESDAPRAIGALERDGHQVNRYDASETDQRCAGNK